ncbi:hypothetical protein, partial [Kitasatospora sp. LaBMicrA B282]|uniref:hypothetical protein n=1 Tax=Kitasatospora sp. LaBMicrA B282 TaxID=3420949 RepID=UPI003D0BBE71
MSRPTSRMVALATAALLSTATAVAVSAPARAADLPAGCVQTDPLPGLLGFNYRCTQGLNQAWNLTGGDTTVTITNSSEGGAGIYRGGSLTYTGTGIVHISVTGGVE